MSNKVIRGDKHLYEPERKCQSSVNNNSNIRRLFEVSPPKNLKSRDRIKEALLNTLDTPVAYTAVYGYSIDWDGCTWTICNYAIACIPTLAMFIVTPIDLQGIETPARLYSKKISKVSSGTVILVGQYIFETKMYQSPWSSHPMSQILLNVTVSIRLIK